jgi:hypothetical protein
VNHSPFEDWLLNDIPVTPAQKRELDLHLRSCDYCSALAATNRVLGSVRLVSPAPGFTQRFQVRLAERKLAERQRKFWGALLFSLGGILLLFLMAGPYLLSFLSSPASWISLIVGWLVFIGSTLFALLDATLVILSVITNFLPPFAWLVLLSMFAGMGLLWSVSIWRFVRVPQGV